ncbi:unnamed protein product [Darwinula stevensoni]|uniref:Uncharacterized protein n=1 Tax=Darwinula stevensoni TaxID=69355 RepID=A0A7R9A410_9CRUS|nr:unnamed protein product [Darwinula stevensoni]CAG0882445.1 unnamed protein product [Darwinula stevensoni]
MVFQLIRKGWDTIPEVMAAGALGTALYRPDDPRAEPVLHPNPNFKWPDYPEPKCFANEFLPP